VEERRLTTEGEVPGAGGADSPGAGADTAAGEAPASGELFPSKPSAEVDAVVAPQSDEQALAEAAQQDLSLLAEAARFVSPQRVCQVLEALLFAAEKPLDLPSLMEATRFSREQVTQGLAALSAAYAERKGGIVLADVGARWQLRTEPAVGAYVRRILQVKPLRLTRAALETLAIIAYRQPITRPEIEELRSVDCGAVTKALLERKLVRILGKKEEPGRPLIYGTSKDFLDLFGLRDLTQLPTLREFQELSEESRRIVEEEHPDAPPVQGIVEASRDPGLETKLAASFQESDAALDQLERAMAVADERQKVAQVALAPATPPVGAPGAGTGAGAVADAGQGEGPVAPGKPDREDGER
jgi:segregation and condensation protein B